MEHDGEYNAVHRTVRMPPASASAGNASGVTLGWQFSPRAALMASFQAPPRPYTGGMAVYSSCLAASPLSRRLRSKPSRPVTGCISASRFSSSSPPPSLRPSHSSFQTSPFLLFIGHCHRLHLPRSLLLLLAAPPLPLRFPLCSPQQQWGWSRCSWRAAGAAATAGRPWQ